MGNGNRIDPMKRLLCCVASLTLAFSLFAMPAMAFAETSSDTGEGQDRISEDVSIEIGSSEGEESEIPDTQDKQDSQPSFFDSIIQFFADISPFSVTPESMQDASIQVTLNTLVPLAAQAAGNELTLTLKGTSGGGTMSEAFKPKTTTYSNFITDPHSGAGDASVYANSTDTFVAEITSIPAGTYNIEVTGKHYGKYAHGSTVTLRDGDRADFSLVDSLYGDPIPSDNKRIGLVPYGDFNRDDAVDDKDSAAIAQAVHDGSSNAIYDLTGDGKVDLADVQHFAHTVNKSHAATEVRIIKDISQMDSSFSEGTTATLKPDGTGSGSTDPTEVGNSLFYNDGDTIELKHQTGADITAGSPVGFTIDSKGVDVAAFAVQFPLDENNKPYFMGDGGMITLKLDDPVGGDSDADKTYTLNAKIIEATGNIKDPEPIVNPNPDPDQEEHEYDFMYDRVKAYLFTETGQLVVKFPDSVSPVKLRSAEISFTSTTNPSNKTIEISHVEFVDNVDDLNLPVFPDTPQIVSAETGDEQIQLVWEPQDDAIAYNVEVGIDNKTDVYTTSVPKLDVDSHSESGSLENNKAYNLRVRSVGLSGNSAWSASVTAIPEDRTAPSNISAPALSAGYSQIAASWDAVDNADSYILHFRKAGDENFSSAELGATSYTVKNLESYTEYEFYLEAENEYGISESSDIVRASTTSAGGKIPWFNLINRASQNADLYPAVNSFSSVEVEGMNTDAAKAAVDGNFDTYVELGGASEKTGGTNATVVATFNEARDVRNMAFTTYLGEGYSDDIENVYVRAIGKTADGTPTESELLTLDNGVAIRSVPAEGGSDTQAVNTVYVELPYTLIGTETLRFSFTRTNGEVATVSELAFYSPSGLEDEIAGIWADETRISLSEGMDADAFASLEKRLDATDGDSIENGHAAERHPLVDEYAAELESARQMLDFDDPVVVDMDTSITTSGANIGGLNAWQPLGITARAGETLKVYVSTPSNKTGEATRLRLIASQYMGGEDSQFVPVGYLLSGMNEITMPVIGELPSGVNVERGGALYVEYTGDLEQSSQDAYKVSVLGGTKIPVLDLTGLSGDGSQELRSERIMQYTTQLVEYVNTLSKIHGEAGHAGTGFLGMFVDSDCSANITEIITDRVILTLPATRVVLELGSTDIAEVVNSIAAMVDVADGALGIAYQHKGLFDVSQNPNLTKKYGANNDISAARHNIRCMSLPEGESVCFASNYIGISWDGASSIIGAEEVELSQDGTYDSGSLFGTSIAHAIGHQLSDNASAIPEVTANYFTQLLTSHDNDESVVFAWNDVLDRVTSGTKGELDARLGAACLWQLHLAYDPGFSYTTHSNPDDQMADLIFARINAYARNVEKAPYGLSLDGADQENKLMRLACAAASRDLLEFFEAWGLEPDKATIAYASNFAKEKRAIQYFTDGTAKEAAFGVGVGIDDVSISANINFTKEDQAVCIDNIKAAGVDSKNAYGFEILRQSADGGYAAVGFVRGTDASFSEDAALLPESDVSYRIRMIDNACNTSALSEAISVRVEHSALEGGVANFTMLKDRSAWSATTNMVSASVSSDDNDAFADIDCASVKAADLSAMFDGDNKTAFEGNVVDEGMKHQLTIAFNDVLEVSGLRYCPTSKDKSFKGVDIEISQNGKDWIKVDSSMLYFPAADNYKGFDAFGRSDSAVIYFSDAGIEGGSDRDRLATYTASYIRLTEWCENADPVSIAEIDVLCEPIYSISFKSEDEHFGMGKLTEDVTFEVMSANSGSDASDASGAQDANAAQGADKIFIPKGSLVIMGDYTGNPVYNTVVVKDQSGRVLIDPSGQIIITNKVGNNDAAIVDRAAMVRSGTWLYYFEPGTYEDMLDKWGEIHPELYRTDGSNSIEGAKLVSVGSAAKIPRQGINDAMDVDLFGIALGLGAYEIHR